MKIINEKEVMEKIRSLILEDSQDLRWNFIDMVGLTLDVKVENDIGNMLYYNLELQLSEQGGDE